MDAGQLLFVLCLIILTALRTKSWVSSPREYIHLRIGLLGLALAGLTHHFIARLDAAITTALIVWSPIPFMMRMRHQRQKKDSASESKPQFFKARRPAAMACPPCKPA